MQKRRHAMDLVIRELLKDHGSQSHYPIGKLHELGGACGSNEPPAQPAEPASVLSDAIPSWFLIKPTPELDGVQILTHNYSVITGESADNVLAATRQLLRIALQAANTRLLLEEMAETHLCPSMLVVPDHKSRREKKAGQAVLLESQSDMPATAATAVSASVATSGHPQLAPEALSAGGPYDIASAQYMATFPLQYRTRAKVAIQTVISAGMVNNRIDNRESMFFVRDGQSIFYASLDEGILSDTDGTLLDATVEPGSAELALPESAVAELGQSTSDSASPGSGAHTVATTSPDPSAFTPYGQANACTTQAAAGLRKRSPLVPTVNIAALSSLVTRTEAATPAGSSNTAFYAGSPRRGTGRRNMPETAPPSAVPGSPTGSRFMLSSLTNLQGQRGRNSIPAPSNVSSSSPLMPPALSRSPTMPGTSTVLATVAGDTSPVKPQPPQSPHEDKRADGAWRGSLIQQIGELITALVTMPSISDSLVRRVPLNSQDVGILMPHCNPEPTIVYLPLPQRLGDLMQPFSPSQIALGAVRHTYKHLRQRHYPGESIEEIEYGSHDDGEPPWNMKLGEMMFMYNFNAKSYHQPAPEKADIGSGVAVVQVLPLNRDRQTERPAGGHEPAKPAGAGTGERLYIRTSRRQAEVHLSLEGAQQVPLMSDTLESQSSPELLRRPSHTPSPLAQSRSGSRTNDSTPPREYLRQFERARGHLKLDPAKSANMNESDEGAVWTRATIRLDRLLTYISRVYWTALGDYVSEQILYPVLSSSWASHATPLMSLPDPTRPATVYAQIEQAPLGQSHTALLHTRDACLPKAPCTFTEASKQQVRAMEVARQMAQYWGREDSVKSVLYHRQKLPRVTAISAVPELFRLLENPLILTDPDQPIVDLPTSLFPAFSFRRRGMRDKTELALKGTRQSFCIMSKLAVADIINLQKQEQAAAYTSRSTKSHSVSPARRPQRGSAAARPNSGVGSSARGTPNYAPGTQGWSTQQQQQPAGRGGRGSRMSLATARHGSSGVNRKLPPPSEYKPIADPDPPQISAGPDCFRQSTITWLAIWLVGGELEMVLWQAVGLERESRRKQLLGMIASHMVGVFPGYDMTALNSGVVSSWLDRNVTRDIINKFALETQLSCDDQVHYFNLERYMSPEYMQLVGIEEGSAELAMIMANPPVSGMTENDMKMELTLRHLQPEHLRWARKLTFIDYTTALLIRYDELMRIAERWRRHAAINSLAYSHIGYPPAMMSLGSMTVDTHESSADGRKAAGDTEEPEQGESASKEKPPPAEMIMENARLLHFVCAPLPLTSALKPNTLDVRGFLRLLCVISALLQNLADSYIDYLCSTGYVVTKRFEEQYSWKDALSSLGYSAEQIQRFTQQASLKQSAKLPYIQVPRAYLRFTSEWRSAVPGYVKSSVNPQSIKRFTLELSKFKKLLHAKSFVYDFQLRYVASLLKPLAADDLPASDAGDDEDDDDDDDEIASQMGIDGRKWNARLKRDIKRTVAQSLHVHVDLMRFFNALAQQRYYSTRFSSRRLVRTQFAYFLDHSERYHYYTAGTRPLIDRHNSQPEDAGSQDDNASLFAGCYRLYEGVQAQLQESQYGNALGDPLQMSGHMGLSPQFGSSLGLGSRPLSSLHHQHLGVAKGINIAASAPEPAFYIPRRRKKSADLSRAGETLTTHHRRGSSIMSLHNDERQPAEQRRAAPPLAASYAVGSQYLEHMGRAHHGPKAPSFSSNPTVPPPSPKPPQSSLALTSSIVPSTHGIAAKSLDFTLHEYADSKVHLRQNDSFVRVALMAMTPDCDCCRKESEAAAQQSKERQRKSQVDLGALATKPHHRHHHHHHHRHKKHRHHKHAAGDGEKEERKKHRTKKAGDNMLVDHIDDVFIQTIRPAGQLTQTTRLGEGRPPLEDDTCTSPLDSAAHEASAFVSGLRQTPLQQWMHSLSSGNTIDLQLSGDSDASADVVQSDNAHLTFYIIVDMDPDTTVGLSSLKDEAVRGRNGSLGPLNEPPVSDHSDLLPLLGRTAGRTCDKCQEAVRNGRQLCSLHRIASVLSADMRDWESKGQSSTVDPDEYDREDPDILSWVRASAGRLVRHTFSDYHRDLNWYRIYHHLRMADLPGSLDPHSLRELIVFLERQGWVDVAECDPDIRQLLDLDLPTRRIIEALQMRLRRLYFEPTLVMSSMQSVPSEAGATQKSDSDMHKPTRRRTSPSHPTCTCSHLELRAISTLSLNATPPATPISDAAGEPLSRHSTIEPHETTMLRRSLPSNPVCPTAAIDAYGRILRGQSSDNIDQVLRLLSPLSRRPARKILMDPAFQKILSSYIHLRIAGSPWFCPQHARTITAPTYQWSLVAELPAESPDTAEAPVISSAAPPSANVGVHRRMAYLHEQSANPPLRMRRSHGASRNSASVSSLGVSPAIGDAVDHQAVHSSKQSISSAAVPHSVSPVRPERARVEALPGSLLVVDPDDSEFHARMLLLNPFTFHGILELLFVRDDMCADGMRLKHVRAISRSRHRDGLYEYERKHVNLVFSTVSAAAWDAMAL
ncbi:hypothetical protein DL89DRAFT_268781 [Linderina pennispora]|uniref:Uncharacterized protein n=1 Tax=Linderina pennispora TaxID=61395 RepID=A0A1Y1W4H1_9FUNG|nr:uncharacterized protein DL89DRAFT_268781 [Linderina pennispora]ORX68282.1 hypothetical protein DL89DRAFT_268781 [Linderina pennispora]